MGKQTERVKPQEERYSNSKEIKYDNRGREEVFDVKHNGVSIDWTANITEALATARATVGSIIYSVNMATGQRIRRSG